MADYSLPALSFRIDLFETVTVAVGQTGKEYILHRNVASKSSGFLKAATKEQWKGTGKIKVDLGDVEPVDFEIYAHWLYTGRITLELEETLISANYKTAIVAAKYARLFALYLAGQFLIDTAFCNAIIDGIIETYQKTNRVPSTKCIDRVWTKIPELCPLHRLILRYWTKVARPDNVLDDLPQAFAVMLLREVFRPGNPRDALELPTKVVRCDYHEHEKNTPKCSQILGEQATGEITWEARWCSKEMIAAL